MHFECAVATLPIQLYAEFTRHYNMHHVLHVTRRMAENGTLGKSGPLPLLRLKNNRLIRPRVTH